MKYLTIGLLLIALAIPFSATFAEQIITAEYFFDSDPGLGNGSSVSLTAGDFVDFLTSVHTGALDLGYHNLYVRYQDSTGIWSTAKAKPFVVVEDEPLQTQPIVAAEYFVDSSAAVPIPIEQGYDVSLLTSIDVGAVDLGYHNLYVRYQDSTGVWSTAKAKPFVVVEEEPLQTQPIVAAEYFVDSSAAVPIAIGQGYDVSLLTSVDVGAMDLGYHNLYIRYQDSTGVWSTAKAKPFVVVEEEPLQVQPIVAAEYFVDSSAAVSVAIDSGEQVSFLTAAELGALDLGYHNLYVRYQDSTGVWSTTKAKPFCVLDSALGEPLSIAGANAHIHGEFLGGGTYDTSFALHPEVATFPISYETTLDTIFTDYVFGNRTLPRGNYTLQVRFQDNRGVLSNWMEVPFRIATGLVISVWYPDIRLDWFVSSLDQGDYYIYNADSADGIYYQIPGSPFPGNSYVHTNAAADYSIKFYYVTSEDYGPRMILVNGQPRALLSASSRKSRPPRATQRKK